MTLVLMRIYYAPFYSRKKATAVYANTDMCDDCRLFFLKTKERHTPRIVNPVGVNFGANRLRELSQGFDECKTDTLLFKKLVSMLKPSFCLPCERVKP